MAKPPEQPAECLLHYQQGTSDKVYHVRLREISTQFGTHWKVETEYGRRGSRLIKGPELPPTSWDKARKEFDRIVGEKLKKGYQVSLSSPAADPEIAAQRQALSWLTGGDGSAS